MQEYVDIFDESFVSLGIESKDVAHKKGLWHQTFHCWFFRKEHNHIILQFQRRSANKKDSPLLYDISAAGHLQSGECKEDGVREIAEELGVDVEATSLIYLGVRPSEYRYKEIHNKEFNHVFIFETPFKMDDYTIEESELDALIEMDLEDGFKLFSHEVDFVMCNSMSVQNGKKSFQNIEVSYEDFLPRIDAYYLRVLIMMERYNEGKKYLAI